jgi:anti-sigma regulatory factor (Ser/Thr protein kinase)
VTGLIPYRELFDYGNFRLKAGLPISVANVGKGNIPLDAYSFGLACMSDLPALGVDTGGSNTMSGHTDAVPRTVRHQGCSGGLVSGVGVAPRMNEPGFMALSPAMYRRTYLELGALSTAVPCARLHTKQLLWEWGLSKLADSSVAVVSELVTNALETTIRHQLESPIRLRLSSNGRGALIEVWDADPTPPQLPTLDLNDLPPAMAESGRGLFLVAALSERWGCYTANHGGKVVWTEVVS